MSISPQSQQLYQTLLSADQPLNAKELASRLGIFPNTVYRLTEPLIDMGLITKTKNYPSRFLAKPADEGLSLFLLHQNDWFSKQFSAPKEDTVPEGEIPESEDISLSFIQGRDELMNLSAKELDKTTKSADLIRSGHEIPADTMLALVRAIGRGVRVRMLIQDYSKENAEQIKLWQKNGIEVKKTSLKHIRLMLYDSSTLYFMSYKNKDSGKDLGMKINYPPFAAILSQLFEEWWGKGATI